MDPERRIEKLGFKLPPALGTLSRELYSPLVIAGSLGYVASHGPLLPNGRMITGKVGLDLDSDAAIAASRQAGLSILATLKDYLKELARVQRLLKSLVMINCTPDFVGHVQLADGFSRLFVDVLGHHAGRGVRSAIGVNSLSGGVPVAIEVIVEIK